MARAKTYIPQGEGSSNESIPAPVYFGILAIIVSLIFFVWSYYAIQKEFNRKTKERERPRVKVKG